MAGGRGPQRHALPGGAQLHLHGACCTQTLSLIDRALLLHGGSRVCELRRDASCIATHAL